MWSRTVRPATPPRWAIRVSCDGRDAFVRQGHTAAGAIAVFPSHAAAARALAALRPGLDADQVAAIVPWPPPGHAIGGGPAGET